MAYKLRATITIPVVVDLTLTDEAYTTPHPALTQAILDAAKTHGVNALLRRLNAGPSVEYLATKAGELTLEIVDFGDKTITSPSWIRTPDEYDDVECDEDEDEDDRAWKREIAMEAGMGLGIDAYNDAMGSPVSFPEDGDAFPEDEE